MRKVFINCPFTDDYKELQRAIVFCSIFAGLEPQLTLRDDGNERNRLDKLLEMIEDADLSIHDLSLCKCLCDDEGHTLGVGKKEEYFRQNMPFELGLAWAITQAHNSRSTPARKSILVLEGQAHELSKSMSDASNIDPKPYQGDLSKLIKVVREWFYNQDTKHIVPSEIILLKLKLFNAHLFKDAVALGLKQSKAKDQVNTMHINEWIDKARVWITDN